MNELIEKIVERLSKKSRKALDECQLEVASAYINAISIIHEEAKDYVPDINVGKTNADYIRNMSDEELAELIPCPYGGCDDDYRSCIDCKLDWLKAEREE